MTEEATTPPAAPVADRMAAARAARAAKAAFAAADAAVSAPPTSPPAVAEPDAPEVAEPTILEKVAANQEQARQAKIDALRKAKAGHNTDVGEALVQVRVLKRGAGLISMGDHAAGLGELTYDAGETPSFPQSIAQALEDKGLVEIQ